MHSNDHDLQTTGHDQDAGSVRYDEGQEVYVTRDCAALISETKTSY